MMKRLGWYLFVSLALADGLALVMINLQVPMHTVLVVCGIVFAVLAVVLAIGGHARSRMKRREDEAAAKIAELQDQVDEAKKQSNNGTAVENT